VLAIVSATACHHSPPPTPVQVATSDLAAYQAEVRKVVKDSSRADQVVAMTNEVAMLVDSMVAHEKASSTKVAALTADYGATRAQYDSLLARMSADRRESAQQLASVRVRMAAVVTDAEWEQLKSARVRLLEADLNAVQP
jgi:hypothetical protein